MTTTSSRKTKGLDSSLSKLTLSPPPRQSNRAPPPDSWEDEEEASDPSSDSSTPIASGTTTPQSSDNYPGPPPPTPISPSHRRGKSTDWAAFPSDPAGIGSPSSSAVTSNPRSAARGGADDVGNGKRPEKSAATAGRMIAMGLGVKPGKMSEEQRQYERAVREKERKRVEREKGERARAEREVEEARRSVWEE